MDIYSASKVLGDLRQNSVNLINTMDLFPQKIIREHHKSYV